MRLILDVGSESLTPIRCATRETSWSSSRGKGSGSLTMMLLCLSFSELGTADHLVVWQFSALIKQLYS